MVILMIVFSIHTSYGAALNAQQITFKNEKQCNDATTSLSKHAFSQAVGLSLHCIEVR